jgi:hypothetical protein
MKFQVYNVISAKELFHNKMTLTLLNFDISIAELQIITLRVEVRLFVLSPEIEDRDEVDKKKSSTRISKIITFL